MSVLYKALQKAEKDNEQRQSAEGGRGFDAQRLAGSGAIKMAGNRGMNWRVVTVASVAVTAVAIVAAFFLIHPQEQPRPQVATLTPPRQASQPSAAPTPPQAVAPAASAPDATQVAAIPAPGQQPNGAMAQAAANSSPGPAPASEPPAAVPSPPEETAVGKADEPTAAPVMKPPASAKPAGAIAAPAANQKMPEIPPGSPAQMLSPPISISRADFALSGVGRQVQVREVSQEAQDNVGSGYTALLRGEYDTALGFYDRALLKEPTSVLALLGRGAALQKLHRLDEAQVAYNNALKVDPQSREALTNVTAIISDRMPAEALNRLLELEKQYPGFSPIKAQIGLIYAKTGSMETALDYLRRAVALSPESTMYRYNLALVLDHMELREQAIQAYENVLSALAGGNGPPELSSTEIERRLRYLRVK